MAPQRQTFAKERQIGFFAAYPVLYVPPRGIKKIFALDVFPDVGRQKAAALLRGLSPARSQYITI